MAALSNYKAIAQKKKEQEQKEVEEIQDSRLKRQIRESKAERKERERIRTILSPNIKNNLLEWKAKDIYLHQLDGYFRKKHIFEIKRGLISFSLKIVHKGYMEHYNKKHSSPDIVKLQEKANKILAELVPLLKIP